MNIIQVSLLATIFVFQPAWSNSQDLNMQLNDATQLENAGDIKTSLKRVRLLAKQHKDNSEITLSLGRLLVKNGEVDKAISTLLPITLEHSNDWRPWFWVGTAQLLKKNYVDAGFHLDEALAREGGNVSIWVQRAVLEQALGNPQSSLNLLNVANSLKSNRTDVTLNMGYANEMLGEYEKASQYYRHFLFLSANQKRYARLRSEIIYRLNSSNR